MRPDLKRIDLKTIFLIALCALLAACEPSGKTGVRETQGDKVQDAARVRVELGSRYMEQGKYELAQENLQKALEYDANYVDAHTVIAVLYERIGRSKEAGDHYARAADLAPKNGAVNNNYGQFLCSSGHNADAQKYFTRAMDDPFYKTPDVLYTNAGTCLMNSNSGQVDLAETDFRKALEANPNNAVALYYLPRCCTRKTIFSTRGRSSNASSRSVSRIPMRCCWRATSRSSWATAKARKSTRNVLREQFPRLHAGPFPGYR